jgi:uncharacterized protein involved in response to NO
VSAPSAAAKSPPLRVLGAGHGEAGAAVIEPYRALFPIGLAYALIGAGVWPVHALGLVPYPGPLHLTLMMQGFEQCFVIGFLLTSMPAFTRAERCRPRELAVAAALMMAFGAAALAGWAAAAQALFLASVLFIVATLGRRVWGNPDRPPEEFLFVGFGMLMAMAGSGLRLAAELGGGPELPARFAERLLSLGMVLSLVLGVGSLLVPTFAGLRDPLAIPGVAGPHERRGRRPLYLVFIGALASAFALELAGLAAMGMALRALTASLMGWWVWKLWRLPGRRTLHAFVLWGSGWMTIAGLWAALAWPMQAPGALHLTFIGGFGMLTLGIGTRVVVSHGRHGLEVEPRILDPAVVICGLLALGSRIGAELAPASARAWLATSGTCWLIGWGLWGLRAMPRLVRTRG